MSVEVSLYFLDGDPIPYLGLVPIVFQSSIVSEDKMAHLTANLLSEGFKIM